MMQFDPNVFVQSWLQLVPLAQQITLSLGGGGAAVCADGCR